MRRNAACRDFIISYYMCSKSCSTLSLHKNRKSVSVDDSSYMAVRQHHQTTHKNIKNICYSANDVR